MKSKFAIILICTIIIVLERIFQKELWNYNINIYYHLQSYKSIYLIASFKIFNYLILYLPITVVVQFVFAKDSKIECLIYLLNIFLILYFNSIYKLLYAEPRPYVIEDDISTNHCHTDFGKPSGHSMLAIIISFYHPQLKNYAVKSKFWQFVLFILIFWTGLARIYTGVHTIAQVITGYSHALIICIVSYWILDKFQQQVKDIFSRKISNKLNILVGIIFLLSQIIAFLIRNFIKDSIDKDRRLFYLSRTSDCLKKQIDYDEYSLYLPYNTCFYYSSTLAFVIGVYYGYVLLKKTTFKQTVGQQNIAINALFRITFMTLFSLLMYHLGQEDDYHIYSSYIKACLYQFLFGFNLTYIFPVQLNLLGYLQEQDIFIGVKYLKIQ